MELAEKRELIEILEQKLDELEIGIVDLKISLYREYKKIDMTREQIKHLKVELNNG